jgi:hypothetical protein
MKSRVGPSGPTTSTSVIQQIGMSQAQNPPSESSSEPSSAQKPLASWYTQGLSDGLGDRLLMFDNSSAPSLELLRLRPDFASAPGFEEALRDRVRRLAQFRHPAFARVRAVQHLEPEDGLALISNYTPGKRLSEVLQRARGPECAAALIRQLTPALLLLHQHDTGLAHGALSLDRIVVTPEGRLTIVEHVLGPAIQTLNLSATELAAAGIPVPRTLGNPAPRLDFSSDLFQLGLVATSVLVGRRLCTNEHSHAGKLLDQFASSARRDGHALSPVLRRWFDRALQLDGQKFDSSADAREALDELLESDTIGSLIRVEHSVQPSLDPTISVFAQESDQPAESVGSVAQSAAAPAPAWTPSPSPVQERAPKPTTVDPGAGTDHNARAPQRRTLFDYQPPEPLRRPASARSPENSDQDAGGDRTRVARRSDRGVAAHPKPRPAGRTHGFRSAVAALALLCGAEGGVIAALVYRGWLMPQPSIALDTTESGTNLLVDGRPADSTPLRLTVGSDMRWVRVVSPSPSPKVLAGKPGVPPVGGLQISSPIELQIFEHDRWVGSAPGARLELAPGQHNIEIVNLALGYRLRQTVDVEAGQTVSIYVVPPAGWVNLDAAPWAEVSIDGAPVGRTPVANLPIALGEHEFTFRHPQLGEDHRKAVVKSDAVLRVTANLHR